MHARRKKNINAVAGLHLLGALQGVTWGRERVFLCHCVSRVRLLKPVIARSLPWPILLKGVLRPKFKVRQAIAHRPLVHHHEGLCCPVCCEPGSIVQQGES